MKYKNYTAAITYDADDEIFVGHIAGITDIIGFQADTVRNLKVAFREAVDDYLETCAKINKAPEKTYSGKVMFRINPATHRRAALAAEAAGISLNQWAEDALKQRAARD